MIFLSRRGEQRVVLRPATFEYLKVEGADGVHRQRIPGLTVAFQELTGQGGRGGMFPGLEPGKKGFRGMFDSADYKRVSAGITEHDLVQRMLNARSYGTAFVALSNDSGTTLVDADDQFVKLAPKNGKQYWWCILNGRTFKSTTAMMNHRKGAEFQNLLKEKGLEAKELLQTA